MGIAGNAAITNHDIGLVGKDGRNQPGNVGPFVLAIGIGVDDDIRASGKRRIKATLEGGGQAPVAAMADDMVGAEPPGDIGRAIVAAIVDHQHFDPVDPVDPARQRHQRLGQGLGLVEAGNLNDQLGHGAPPLRRSNYRPVTQC